MNYMIFGVMVIAFCYGIYRWKYHLDLVRFQEESIRHLRATLRPVRKIH